MTVIHGDHNRALDIAEKIKNKLAASGRNFSDSADIKGRRGELTAEEIREITGALVQLSMIKMVDSNILLPGALELAPAYNRTLYDSLYLTLAIAEEAIFITADHKLVNTFMHTPLATNIIWLSEFDRTRSSGPGS